MSAPDARDELLAAMFAAWVRDIESEPLADIEAAAMRGDHAPGHELASS